MRLARRMLAAGVLRPGGPVASGAAEGHYLQFDGTTDYAYADAVFGGISGDYTVALKVAGPLSATTGGRYFATGGPGLDYSAQSRHDRAYRSATTVVSSNGYNPTTGSLSYSLTASGNLADVPLVIAITRQNGGNASLIIVSGSGVEHTASAAATMFKPDHLAIGASLSDALAAVASTFGAVRAIGAILAAGISTSSELEAWLAADTAVGNVSNIDHYWAFSDLSGSSCPARVGTVALTVSGPTTSDLVAL